MQRDGRPTPLPNQGPAWLYRGLKRGQARVSPGGQGCETRRQVQFLGLEVIDVLPRVFERRKDRGP